MAEKTRPGTFLDQFTQYVRNEQMSPVLPVAGLSLGAITHLLRRKSIPSGDHTRDLLRSILVGGLTGTGAEIARVGGARLYSDITSNNSIPNGVVGVVNPRSLHSDNGI